MRPEPLSDCAMKKQSIKCSNTIYRLVRNKKNSSLDHSVFLESNQLMIPAFSGKAQEKKELSRYLTRNYRLYIQKMLDLGLGEATMTYTKFYYTFEHALENKIDFSERFLTMYQFLKKDKRTMSVQQNTHKSLPVDLKDCELLTNRLVTCSHEGKNIIYEEERGEE